MDVSGEWTRRIDGTIGTNEKWRRCMLYGDVKTDLIDSN